MEHANLPSPSIRLAHLDDLPDADTNPRLHPPEHLQQVAASIRRFGFTNPILHDYEGKETVAGHGRKGGARLIFEAGEPIYLAPGKERGGKELPLGMVPVIDVSGWSEDERRAYLIADNALTDASTWDAKLLGGELMKLEAANFDMNLLGLSEMRMVSFIAAAKPDPLAEPTIEPGKAAISRKGDVWMMGDHLLICGDCTDPEVVEKVHGGEADLTLTDPPYGIGYEYRDHDDRDADANAELVEKAFALSPAAKVWTPGAMNVFRDGTRFGRARQVIWYKKFAQAGNGLGGASTFEPVLVIDPPEKQLANDVIEVGTDREALDGAMLREHHPCPKPVELYERLIRAFSPARAAIYEPFCGSGTTLIACERTHRHCRAVEIDPIYCDVIVKRWIALTGNDATREEDGASFRQLAQESASA